MKSVSGNVVFTIGELARRTGLPVKTIRFYSDEGLLPPTDRTPAGYRLYDHQAMARLELVKTLRELGLGLADVERALTRQASLAELAGLHVDALDEQIRRLRLRRGVLRAVAKRGTELEEVELMNKLASMSDEERARLLDDFWNEMAEGLDVDSEFYQRMRSVRADLPDDPSPEQLEAWIEFAELVRDPGFRRTIRQVSELNAAENNDEAGKAILAAQHAHSVAWCKRAQAALAEGHGPGSAAGRALAEEVATACAGPGRDPADPGYRTAVADRLAKGSDERSERFWQLLGVINGWPERPSIRPAMQWIVDAVLASRS